MSEPDDLNAPGLRAYPDAIPVVMLNLMKFRPHSADGDGTGWDAYQRYSRITVPLIRRHGGDVLWAGPARGVALGPVADGDWDYAALVRYPDKAAFLAMMRSDAYAAGNPHRRNGLARHLILACEEAFSRFPAAGAEGSA